MDNWPPATLENEITTTPEAVVDECYRLICFEPGSEPNWEEFKSLFHPQAVLALRVFPGDDAISVMNLDEYTVIQMRQGMKKDGDNEEIIRNEWLKHGSLAETRVVFTMQFGTEEPIMAFDAFQLVYLEDRWWIVSILSEIGDQDARLPI